jgi:hypothetical protein
MSASPPIRIGPGRWVVKIFCHCSREVGEGGAYQRPRPDGRRFALPRPQRWVPSGTHASSPKPVPDANPLPGDECAGCGNQPHVQYVVPRKFCVLDRADEIHVTIDVSIWLCHFPSTQGSGGLRRRRAFGAANEVSAWRGARMSGRFEETRGKSRQLRDVEGEVCVATVLGVRPGILALWRQP